MVEKDNKSGKPEANTFRQRRLSTTGRSIISVLSEKTGEAPIFAASFRYTPEELAKLGDGDFKVGSRRVLKEIIKQIGKIKEDGEDVPRPLQEELDTTEPTDFGIPPKSEKPN